MPFRIGSASPTVLPIMGSVGNRLESRELHLAFGPTVAYRDVLFLLIGSFLYSRPLFTRSAIPKLGYAGSNFPCCIFFISFYRFFSARFILVTSKLAFAPCKRFNYLTFFSIKSCSYLRFRSLLRAELLRDRVRTLSTLPSCEIVTDRDERVEWFLLCLLCEL